MVRATGYPSFVMPCFFINQVGAATKFVLLGCCNSLKDDTESCVSEVEVETTFPMVYDFSTSIEGGRYHMAGVACFTLYHSSGDFAALHSHTTG